jgi:Fe2+ transport system protein FeoA
MSTLASIKAGGCALIESFNIDDAIVAQLAGFGIRKDSKVSVVGKNFDGSLIVQLYNIKVAIAATIAVKILVKAL